jgi:lipopolysaccharide export system protein LptA
MRGTRWLLLVAMAVIVGGVAFKYRARKLALEHEAPAKPAPLANTLNSTAEDWQVSEADQKTGRKRYDIRAKNMETLADSSRVDLKGVTMRIYSKDGDSYDLVKSAAATFDTNTKNLYSAGETEITVGLPVEGQPSPDHMPTVIKTSGVSFDSNTNRADTDQPSTFVFAKGEGKATGATYDPTTQSLQMKHNVEIYWKPPKPDAVPMKIEADSLSYHEAKGEIWLNPRGKMTRENTVVEGEQVVVYLQDKQVIHHVTAVHAHGTDDYPNRKLRYAADELAMDFDDEGKAQKIVGEHNAQLVSTGETAETTVTADHVDMDLDTSTGDSVLTKVSARGNGVVNSKPLATPGHQISETHILRSETFEIQMRPGGREIASLVTNAPGKLEFLPNLPAQRHRLLDGKDFVITYGQQNRVDSFRAHDVKTQTEPNEDERKRKRPASSTSSRDFEAHFDPKTSKLASMQQSGNFVYEEGERRARASKATMDADLNLIVLDSLARVWDSTGTTSADRIRMDQRSGDFTAEGNVVSSRLPDRDQKKNSDMLSGDEPMQATAKKMDSRNHNRTIHYEGTVNLWQGANRIRADTVDIDRVADKRTLTADGHVITNLWEEPKDEEKKKAATPVLTEVRASHMVYTDDNRLAYYTGGVSLNRPGLRVKGTELRAFLADSGADSRLDKAFADGTVDIFSTGKDRTRHGTGEHAEYYTDEQRVILNGTWVKMIEQIYGRPRPNTTEGTELTYYANDDRLLVNGAKDKPGNTRITRKKGK